MDPKTILHEGAQLQLRILRIDAERRRLGLSLRQADEIEEGGAATKAATLTEEVPAGVESTSEQVQLQKRQQNLLRSLLLWRICQLIRSRRSRNATANGVNNVAIATNAMARVPCWVAWARAAN